MMDAKSIVIPEGAVARIRIGDDVIWKTKKIITETPMKVMHTGAERVENTNLTVNAEQGVKNTDYFTFKYIPIEPGCTYYNYYGTRSWFFDRDKKALKSINVRTQSTPYQFTAPENACYISISYNYTSVGDKDVYINKVV
jgi:hypothetical protein